MKNAIEAMRADETAAAPGEARQLCAADMELIRTRLCAAAGKIAAAECWWLDLVSECDEVGAWFGYGVRDCAHWLSHSCSMSGGTAREHVRVARALRTLPLLHAEFAAGRLSYSKVREATRIADRVDESVLVTMARTCTASQLQRSVRGYRRAANDRLHQEKRRKVRWFTDEDGMFVLTARFPPEEGASLLAALRIASDQLSTQTRPLPSTAPEDARDRAAEPPDPMVSSADALLQVAAGFLDNSAPDLSGEDRDLVVVHVDAQLLAEAASTPGWFRPGPATGSDDVPPAENPRTDTHIDAIPRAGSCEVAGVGGVSPATTARMACDAVVIAMVRSSGGAVLSHGRRRRLVSAAQRRVLMVRDGGCQFPACNRTTHLTAHHVKHWAAGGTTDLDNLVLLCRLHHVAVHEAGFAVHHSAESTVADPRWRFTDPTGAEMTTKTIARDDSDCTGYPSAFPLNRDLDHVTHWKDEEAAAIRPLWAGERVSIQDIVCALFGSTFEGSEKLAHPVAA